MKGAMVSVATGAMNSVLDKLTTLLGTEFSWLHTGVKRDIAFLKDELSRMNALLEKMSGMELVDSQMKDWRNQVREMAYDIEDCIDGYMLQQRHSGIVGFFHDYVKRVMDLVAHDGVAQQIKELKDRVVEAGHRRKRYKIDTEVHRPGATSIDPRLPALYVDSSDLVGIDAPREKLMNFLDDGELSLKVVSVVGFGGLGKTTLAKEVYKKICVKFDCHALVSVSQKPDVKKILWSILSQVKSPDYANNNTGDEERLIDALRGLLKDSRYFIIIDDIWDTQVWKIIKCALLENNHGSRIIVTTRISSVAKTCCSHHHGTVYELTPLREADSKILFYKRTFGSEDLCPSNLRDVANEMIKRCGGMPLAIITMASLMTTKSNRREEWVIVHSLMGLGLQNYVEGMEKILSLSYSDLPYHLKTCLLYLSMYPEDSEIDMHQVVRRWMAEGFINIKSGRSYAEEGECYFNELINRSLIQPARIGLDGQVTSCRVHDMILDLIISKAVEENFITFTGDQTNTLVFNEKVRRLSVDYRGNENIMSHSSMVLSHVRSLCILGYSQKMLPISNFQALRVLDLDSSVKLENCYLQKIGHLFQLRYLRIAASRITHLPEQIGELKFLETLDLGRTWIRNLPTSIVTLQRLNFLYVNGSQLLDGIGKMQSLKELTGVSVYDACSMDSLRELGSLTNLKTLRLTWHISEARKDRTTYTDILASSLGELVSASLRNLCIVRGPSSVDIPLDSWSAPPHHLRGLDIPGCCFQRMPEWMASMANLFRLSIKFKQVTQEILDTLGNLHSLLDLELRSEAVDYPMKMLIVCNSRFQCLKIFRFYGLGLMFEDGAAPQLEQLSVEIRAHQVQSELADNADLGIHHLTSLRGLNVWINCAGASMEVVEILEASITDATKLLPNKPTSHFYRENQEYLVTDEIHVQGE